MIFGEVDVAAAEGCVLAHSVMTPDGRLPKGRVLSVADCLTLEKAGISRVIAARLEPGDLGEDAAAGRIASVLPLDNMSATAPATGRVNFHATDAGLFRAERVVVDALNAIDPAITLATLADRSPVRMGDLVATVKIIPLAVAGKKVEDARHVLQGTNAFSVRPYRAMRVGLIATELPSLKPSVMDKTARLLEERLSVSASTLATEARCAHDPAAVARHIRDMAAQLDMIVVFGASALTDEGDVIPSAIRLAGGGMRIVGMPVDPGNLLCLGYVGDVPVIGAPGCARSPKENGFDWILNRILAGEKPDQADVAAMGVGGLLMEIPLRPLPREKAIRAGEPLKVGVAVLAAGKASRMAGHGHKLLAEFDGEPLVRRSVRQAMSSGGDGVVVVTGDRAGEIGAAVSGLGCETVLNPAYETGMASSINAGLGALADMDGLCIALADMPGVTSADFARLIDRFKAEEGAAIVRAVSDGKRGNPVILPKSLFPAIARLEGDVGARHIIEKSGLPVVDVEIGSAAHLDVDTPDAIRAAGGTIKA